MCSRPKEGHPSRKTAPQVGRDLDARVRPELYDARLYRAFYELGHKWARRETPLRAFSARQLEDVLGARKRLLPFVPALAAALVIGASSASADTGLHITLAVPKQATAGAPISVGYTSVGLPSHAQLVVQRQMGTGRVWRTVATLRRLRLARADLPPLGLGRYSVRIAVISKGVTIPDPPAALDVYGTVSFTTLFPGGDGGGDDNGPGTLQTQTTSFPYAFSYYNGAGDFSGFGISRANPCRSVSLNFLPWDQYGPDPDTVQGTATVVQESQDPVSVTAPGNTVGTVDASLTPGQSWGLNLAQTPGSLFTWGINGTASCDAEHMPGTE